MPPLHAPSASAFAAVPEPPPVVQVEVVPPRPSDAWPVGIAGTVTTLAAVSLGLVPYDGPRVHGHRMSATDVRRVADELARVDLPARRTLPGMEPKRADVIVAGSRIALALLDHWTAGGLIVSDRGVRWGLAEELAER